MVGFCCCCCFLWFLGEEKEGMFVWGFFNGSVTCHRKHEDKIEPCQCCFGFVMNQQVGSFI